MLMYLLRLLCLLFSSAFLFSVAAYPTVVAVPIIALLLLGLLGFLTFDIGVECLFVAVFTVFLLKSCFFTCQAVDNVIVIFCFTRFLNHHGCCLVYFR